MILGNASFIIGCQFIAVALIWAARIRAQGALAAARASAPVFAANAGGTVSVIVQDPNAKIGSGQ